MSGHLVVPIDVAALAVGTQPLPANTGFMPAMTSFHQLPYASSDPQPFVSEFALAQPFIGGNVPEQGVHLHWAMPDALTRGTRPAGADGKPLPGSALQFPALPDRWLVTRTALTNGVPGPVRSWVVDSRFIAASVDPAVGNLGSNAVPWQTPGDTNGANQPYQFLGRKLPLEVWKPSATDTYLDTLDISTFAMVELAAYYPNARNVFGFLDDLNDLLPATELELCYAVTGWHTRAQDDPLAGKSADAVRQILQDKKWRATDDGPFDGTAYCGCIASVTWSPNIEPAQPGALTATIGNNTTETLSALIVKSAPSAPAHGADDIEFQLHALLSGQLPLLGDPAGPRQVTRQLHQQRFSPVPVGNVWFVRQLPSNSNISGTLRQADGANLDALNLLQEDTERLLTVVSGKQWQLFADWYKYLKLAYPAPSPNPAPDQSEAAMGYLQKRVADLEAAIAAYEAKLQETQNKAGELKASIAAVLPPASFDLTTKPGKIFYRPADPTILLSGPDIVPALRYGGDHLSSPDGLLACRASSRLVSGLAAPANAVAGSGAFNLGAADLPATLGSATGIDAAVVALAQAFTREAILLWPNGAAALLAAKAGGTAALAAWQAWVKPQEDAFLGSAGKPTASGIYQGTPPSLVGIELWEGNPWLPILMHWQLTYWPAHHIPAADATQSYDPHLILSRLHPENDSLDDAGVDLVLTGTPGTDEVDYQGITFITPHAGYTAWNQLNAYKADNPHSPLAPLADAAQPMPLLSQSLSGFHDRFLLRRRTLQIGIRDPFAQGDDEFDLIRKIRDNLAKHGGRASTMAPMAEDAFCPVRSGMLGPTLLRLVDAFGQYREYQFGTDANAVTATGSLSPAQMFAGPATAPAFMPPRLSQPAALHLRWLAADNSGVTGTRMSTSPICGWVVPNYLDESVMIYDAGGTALGSLTRNAEQPWRGSPSNPGAFTQTAETLFASQNPHLRDFVLALKQRGGDYLAKYLDAINGASSTIHPLQHAQSAQLPILLGQPLALVRATVTLEIMGDPAINNSWAAFTQDMNDPSGKRTTNGHGGVKFPVLLGSVDDPDDGLVGFYLDDTDRFGTFHAVGPGSGTDVPTRKIDTVAVDVANGAVTLTMLVDPRCQIHATTGYMPTQTIAIPTEMFRDAFARIAVTFLTAPVMLAAQSADAANPTIALPLPLPGRQKGDWSWVSITAGTTGQVPHSTPAVALATDQVFNHSSYTLQDGWLSLQGFED